MTTARGKLRLVHAHDDYVDVSYQHQLLFRYVYRPETEQRESPKPYLHPLHTLAGNLVTIYRPYDHVWHKGLAMTQAVLSGQNFWGGPTYVHGQGYVQLPNNGGMIHRGWDRVDAVGETASLVERLDWVTQAGESWLAERREIGVLRIDPDAGAWWLGFSTRLTNIHGAPLVFGSPTTEGRPLAGYGGLFWRGPRSFFRGKVFGPGDLEGPESMGRAAPWLAYTGRHDGTAGTSTLVFFDQPGNPRYPTKWFVRTEPYACVSYAFTFDEELTLAPAETLTFTYRILIADGAWDRERVEQYRAAIDGAGDA